LDERLHGVLLPGAEQVAGGVEEHDGAVGGEVLRGELAGVGRRDDVEVVVGGERLDGVDTGGRGRVGGTVEDQHLLGGLLRVCCANTDQADRKDQRERREHGAHQAPSTVPRRPWRHRRPTMHFHAPSAHHAFSPPTLGWPVAT
jgi:hypothetical protein